MGCGAQDDQNKFIRLTVKDETRLTFEIRDHGRGGYLHALPECWQGFLRKKNLHRTFRREVAKDAKERLIQELKERYRE
jgi:predicted RNA-binding protein YlxR (DUF448 family)